MLIIIVKVKINKNSFFIISYKLISKKNDLFIRKGHAFIIEIIFYKPKFSNNSFLEKKCEISIAAFSSESEP